MKKRIFKILCLVLCGIILSSNTLVFAKTVEEAKLDNRVIKSRIKDSNGKETIEYYNLNYLSESYYSSNSSKAFLNLKEAGLEASAYNTALASSTAPTYTSRLSGAYSDYTQALATADATQFINRIYVNMQAWLAAGTYVGQDTHTNPDGTTTCNQTAFMNVPINPFNYQFGSALSQHTYTCIGYEFVSHSLSWRK